VILESSTALDDLLRRSRTIAIVGASPNPARPSHDVFTRLRAMNRFDVTPINPGIATIDGVTAFGSLSAYAADQGAPDIVDVFRRASEAPTVARDAVAIGAKAIWFQYGVVNAEAIALADAAGLDVVVDRCLKIEAIRLGR